MWGGKQNWWNLMTRERETRRTKHQQLLVRSSHCFMKQTWRPIQIMVFREPWQGQQLAGSEARAPFYRKLLWCFVVLLFSLSCLECKLYFLHCMLFGLINTVYAIYFAYRYFRKFWTRWGNLWGLYFTIFVMFSLLEVEIFARTDSRNSRK